MERDFGKLLQTWGSDPLMWRQHALELKIAADALLPPLYETYQEGANAPGVQRHRFAYIHGYYLLVGLAIENAIKGLRIAEDPSLISVSGVDKILGVVTGSRRGFSSGLHSPLTRITS